MSITKFGKKILSLIAVIALAFTLFACGGGENTSTDKDEKKAVATQEMNDVYDTLLLLDSSAMVNVQNDIPGVVTTTKYASTTVTWESSLPDVMSAEGKVTRPEFDDERAEKVNGVSIVRVTLTATITTVYTYIENEVEETESIVRTKDYAFTVQCLPEAFTGSIKEVKDAAYQYVYVDQGVSLSNSVSASDVVFSVKFYGVVTAKLAASGAGQFMVHDGTDGIYVYANKVDVQIGDTVLITGDVYSYYGNLQVGSNIAVTVVEPQTGVAPSVFEDISVSEWDKNYVPGRIGGQLYNIYCKLETGSNAGGSDKYKLVDPYTGDTAWIYYKSYTTEAEAVLTTYVGKYVNIQGVSYDRDSRFNENHLIWNGVIEEAATPDLTDEQKLLQVKNAVAELAGEYVAGSKLDLPTANADYNATIEWTIPEGAPYANGQFALVDANKEFTASAKITVGAISETVEVKFVVKMIAVMTIAQAIAQPVGTVVKLEGTVEIVYGSNNNYYLKDDTGCLLVYVKAPNGITVGGATYQLKPGDQVSFIGATNVFNGTPQIGSITEYVSYAAGEWEQSAPTEVTFAEVKAYTSANAPYGEYLMLKGKIVSDGSYFLFNEDVATDPVSINLFNSTVPERLKAIADTDTTATLLFYYYGNSKADYTGTIRVIFAGRDGEYFIGDETVVVPEKQDYKAISAAKKLATSAGVDVTIQGVVTAVGSFSDQNKNFTFLVADATGAIVVYRATAADATEHATLAVGDLVKLTGKATIANGQYRLTGVSVAAIEKVSTGNTVPAYVDITADVAAGADLTQYQGQLVKVSGIISTVPAWGTSSGITLAVKVSGKTFNIYIHKTDFPNADIEALLATMAVNQEITVQGYLNWYNAAQITPIAGAADITLGAVTEPEPSGADATVSYTGSTTNMVADANNAATIGLDATKFTVTAIKNDPANLVGLGADGTLRLYSDRKKAGGNGSAFEVTCTEVIATIKINFTQNAEYAKVFVNGEEVVAVNGVYTINANSFTVQNTWEDATASSNLQVRLDKIEIFFTK